MKPSKRHLDARARRALLLLVVALVSAAGCASRSGGFGDDSPKLIGDTDAGPGDAPECQAKSRCSRDLHSILEGCTGDVIRECPSNQGCREGAC